VDDLITTVLAFLYAYGLTRTTYGGRKPLLRGHDPLVRRRCSRPWPSYRCSGQRPGHAGLLKVEWNIYGATGSSSPKSFIACPRDGHPLLHALRRGHPDGRGRASLGASGVTTFFKITVPTSRYGIFSAAALTFNLTITDS